MIDEEIQSELMKQLGQLSPAQRQVLQFARSLEGPPPKGVPGDRLLRFAGIMSKKEAKEFLQGI
jgi:hypothetical protein